MELRKIEECKIDCARKFVAEITSEQVKYEVVNSFEKLMELVKPWKTIDTAMIELAAL